MGCQLLSRGLYLSNNLVREHHLIQVAERVKDQKMEIVALNEMLKKAREKESHTEDRHKSLVERMHVSGQERLDAANKAAQAAENACLQLRESVATQLADTNKRCHQAEAKTKAVCVMDATDSCRVCYSQAYRLTWVATLQIERKVEQQRKAFKMRILTLEASIKDLKQTNEDLRQQISGQEHALAVQAEELALSQARERMLVREVDHANDALAEKNHCVSDLETQVELVRREMALQLTSRKVLAQNSDGCFHLVRANGSCWLSSYDR